MMFQHNLAPAVLLLLAKACCRLPRQWLQHQPSFRPRKRKWSKRLLYFYSSQDNCDNDEWEQFYDNTNQDSCIPPQFTWDYYLIDECRIAVLVFPTSRFSWAND
ncbi:hypothetical protein LA080_004108 [Diaporthe eres]|nr:hypothetical protein LA080_004108 [Diaporthe eres]